jgi:hypothetical protein
VHERDIVDALHRARTDDGRTRTIGLGFSVSFDLARMMDGDHSYRRECGWTIFELEPPIYAAPDDGVRPVSEVTPTSVPTADEMLVPHV